MSGYNQQNKKNQRNQEQERQKQKQNKQQRELRKQKMKTRELEDERIKQEEKMREIEHKLEMQRQRQLMEQEAKERHMVNDMAKRMVRHQVVHDVANSPEGQQAISKGVDFVKNKVVAGKEAFSSIPQTQLIPSSFAPEQAIGSGSTAAVEAEAIAPAAASVATEASILAL